MAKSLRVREKELQLLLPTAQGQVQIQELAARYAAAQGREVPIGTSLITYILVYEREQGFISV